ncbi:MAG: hypothetical protein ACLTK7_08450 [Clostridium paraputrificum]
MIKKTWEINGNLYGEDGLENIQDFEEVIIKVKSLYDEIFGEKVMNKYDLYVDNATKDSGYSPIITVVLRKYIIIKLKISGDASKGKIAYQFAHELTHFVFYSYFGLNKPFANCREETICSAASLIIIRDLFPDEFNTYNVHVKSLDEECYRRGADYAESIDYSLEKLKDKIMEFIF